MIIESYTCKAYGLNSPSSPIIQEKKRRKRGHNAHAQTVKQAYENASIISIQKVGDIQNTLKVIHKK